MSTATTSAQATARPASTPRPPRDRVENFHGNQLLYVLWERHPVVCAPIALAVPPSLSFGQLVSDVLPDTVFAQHPDWAKFAQGCMQWSVNGQPLKAQPGQTLTELGLTHKTLLRLRVSTPQGVDATRV